jgi:hypothetical protein
VPPRGGIAPPDFFGFKIDELIDAIAELRDAVTRHHGAAYRSLLFEEEAAMSKPTQMIDLRDIVVQPNRMRQLRPEVVDEVAASVASEGLAAADRGPSRPQGGWLPSGRRLASFCGEAQAEA